MNLVKLTIKWVTIIVHMAQLVQMAINACLAYTMHVSEKAIDACI